jgi:3-phenylpropionate/trans-cinnamate dioxygenase ferredoxin subunit
MQYRVAAVSELEREALMRVEIGDVVICLAHTESGDWYAISDTCSHEEYSLSEGDLWGLDVECPMHGSRFDLATGEPDQLPAVVPIQTYKVTVQAGEVFVEL